MRRNTVIALVFGGLVVLALALAGSIAVLRWNNPDADVGELGTALLGVVAVFALFFPRDGHKAEGADGKPLIEDERDEK